MSLKKYFYYASLFFAALQEGITQNNLVWLVLGSAIGIALGEFYHFNFILCTFIFLFLLINTIAFKNFSWFYRILFFCSSVLFGIILMTYTLEQKNTNFLKKPLYNITFEAKIREIIPHSNKTNRIIFDIKHGVNNNYLKNLSVRLVATQQITKDFAKNDIVTITAHLFPLPELAAPDSYNFKREAFFENIQGIGRLIKVKSVTKSEDNCFRCTVNTLRQSLKKHLYEILPQQEASIVIALLIGDRDGISDDIQDNWRASGIYHILSISGLHMTIITLFVFTIVRFFLCLVPFIINRFNTKKWAAFLTIFLAGFYWQISGLAIATTRSYIMCVVVLIAIMLDRRALSINTVLISALIIFIFLPQSLLQISFQLSFMAVLTIIAVHEGFLKKLRPLQYDKTHSIIYKYSLFFVETLIISICITVTTSPFTIYVFGTSNIYGGLSNLIAVPLTSFFVMPMGVLALIFMPFGLDKLFFELMGLGAIWLNSIASYVAHLPYSVQFWSQTDKYGLIIFALCIFLMITNKKIIRYSTYLGAIVGLYIQFSMPYPMIMLSQGGGQFAIRTHNNKLTIYDNFNNSYLTEIWLKHSGFNPKKAEDYIQYARCPYDYCVFKTYNNKKFAYVKKPFQFKDLCQNRFDYIITSLKTPSNCKAKIKLIDKKDFKNSKAFYIYE